MGDSVTWNYDKPVYDQQRRCWYYEGRRSDGSKVRKYVPAGDGNSGQAAQNDTRANYQLTPRNDASVLAAGMQAMNIQSAGSYEGDAQHYTTAQPAGFDLGQDQPWSGGRRSSYSTTSPIPATASLVGAQQGDLDAYSRTPRTSQQGPGGKPQYQDSQSSHTQRPLDGPSRPQYDDGKKDQTVSSYPGGDASFYDQQRAPGTSLYGGYRGSQQHGDAYSTPLPALSASTPADNRNQDKSRKHKHSSRSKGKGHAKIETYGDVDDGKASGYNVAPQYGSPTTAHGTYLNEYSNYNPSGGQEYTSGQYPEPLEYTSSKVSRFGTNSTGTAQSGTPRALAGKADGSTVGDNDKELESFARSLYEQGGGVGVPLTDYRGSTYEPEAADSLSPLTKIHSKSAKADVIRGTPGKSEFLDGRYRVEPSVRFEPGNVFKVMWSEPKGGTVPGGGSKFSETTLEDHMQGVWTGFRRFIVVRNGEGHCSCVPILTYGKLGCVKPGVKPHHHGIVFEQGRQATTLPKEPPLGFAPICMEMHLGEHLSEESRVNYSKLVTVEHNVKVLFIGCVLYDDWPIVQHAVDSCWDAKKPHRSEQSAGGGHGYRSGHRKKGKGS